MKTPLKLLTSTLTLLVAVWPDPAQGASILMMPSNHHSHVAMFSTLGEALAEDGHVVWLLTVERFEVVVRKKQKVRPLIFSVSPEAEFQERLESMMESSPSGEGVAEAFFANADSTFCRYCDDMLSSEDLRTTVEDIHVDLAVVDSLPFQLCLYVLPYSLNIPYVTVFGFQLVPWLAGVTGMPSVEPELTTVTSNRMTFWQRLENLKNWISLMHSPHSAFNSERFMKKYVVPRRPSISFEEVVRQSEIFFVNFEILCLDYPRVSAPNYLFLGGSSVRPSEHLSRELEEFVQGSHHGVVIMSLGSMSAWQFAWRLLKGKMFDAFGRLKQRVIVQYGLDDKDSVPSNVRLMKWLPQNDLLGHAKTRLFITHGGNNGANEAVHHGVPMLVVPLFADQIYSAVRVENHGYGKWVKDKNAVTADELYLLMTEIIENKTYSENIKKCSAITRSMPSAQEKFVFWVNHVLRFGSAHLRPPSMDMPLYQVLMIDVIIFLLTVCLSIIILTFIIIRVLMFVYAHYAYHK